jgi:crossover junction endodeoxyribonuclease RuvC
MKILGIDPGTTRVGYGIIDASNKQKPAHIDSGIISISTKDVSTRLAELYDGLTLIIQKHNPGIVGVEQLFFVKNVTTGIAVAQARGVILLACEKANIPIHEYTPLQIKSILTGYGNADKKVVTQFVQQTLSIQKDMVDDAYDALAVALVTMWNLRAPGI